MQWHKRLLIKDFFQENITLQMTHWRFFFLKKKSRFILSSHRAWADEKILWKSRTGTERILAICNRSFHGSTIRMWKKIYSTVIVWKNLGMTGIFLWSLRGNCEENVTSIQLSFWQSSEQAQKAQMRDCCQRKCGTTGHHVLPRRGDFFLASLEDIRVECGCRFQQDKIITGTENRLGRMTADSWV